MNEEKEFSLALLIDNFKEIEESNSHTQEEIYRGMIRVFNAIEQPWKEPDIKKTDSIYELFDSEVIEWCGQALMYWPTWESEDYNALTNELISELFQDDLFANLSRIKAVREQGKKVFL